MLRTQSHDLRDFRDQDAEYLIEICPAVLTDTHIDNAGVDDTFVIRLGGR
jgi:hypothetical protein